MRTQFVTALSVVLILFTSAYATSSKSSFTVNQDTEIVQAQDAIPAERHAAEELQQYIEKSTGLRLPIVETAQDRPAIFVGPGPETSRIAPDLAAENLGNEEFILETRDGNLFILGGRPRGTLYGVYAFLEDVIGCRWYTRDVEKVPKHRKLTIPRLHRRDKPDFEYREPFFTEAFDRLWASRNRVNSSHADLDESVGDKIYITGFVHTFYSLVPPEKYFDQHPEYFSEINGKRTAEYSQLCLTNLDVLRIVIEAIFKRIEENPKSTIFSVSQNDWYGACQCAQCRAIDEAEGSPSGTLIAFCNKVAEAVAERYPDKYIDTIAYNYTQKAPKTIRPHPNLIVRLCHMAPSCDSHALASCPKNATYVEDLRAWSAISNKVYVWHYVTNFSHYLMPFPNFNAIREDIPFYHREGVDGLFCQGNSSPGGGGEMAELRSYILAKQLWDVDTDVDATIDDFLQGVYGTSWKPIRRYFDCLHDYVKTNNIHFDLYSPPEAGHLPPEIRQKCRVALDEAFRTAENDAVRARVEKVRMWLDYADIYFQRRQLELTGEDILDPTLVERFIRVAKANGVTNISEVNPIEPFYQSLQMRGPYITNWWIIGPFPKEKDALSDGGFGQRQTVSFDGVYNGLNDQPVRWIRVTGPTAYLDFTRFIEPHEIIGAAYAFTFIDSDCERDISIAVGSNDGAQVWVNGEQVYKDAGNHKAIPDQDIVPIHLHAGRNTLLCRVHQLGAGWGLYVRLLTQEKDVKASVEMR